MRPSRPYILVADDDEDDVALFKDCFSHRYGDVDIVHFDSGEEMLRRLATTLPDHLPKVILIDLHLPARRATDILSRLQLNDKYQRMVKIVWSTFCPAADQNRCISLGASYFLEKPTSIQGWYELAERICRYFDLEATG